ncbi:MAG: DUF502 domain-containing protein [Candidatus Omnitrophica bacterium]|nr:DUF502 domain-containing protein [Candidatus Omnitrophota bacterium]
MLKHLKHYFITGILTLLPIVLSIYILVILFNFADSIIGKFINTHIRRWLGFYIPGIGLIIMAFMILICGFIVNLFFKRRLKMWDKFLSGLPFLRYIYPLLKETVELILSKGRMAFKQAVLVEFPRKGSWSVGFISNRSFAEARQKSGQELENVYIPLAPNPASGFVVLIPHSELIKLDISVKEAMKIVITGGIINPAEYFKAQNEK